MAYSEEFKTRVVEGTTEIHSKIDSISKMLKESNAIGDRRAKNWKWQKWLLGPILFVGFYSFAYLLTLIIK